MRLLVEIFLYLSIMLPIFHMLNAIPKNRKCKLILLNNLEEKPITILIPCFNEESIVKNTIDGMLRINYNNFTCIFINNGSNDNTLEMLKELLNATETYEEYTDNLHTTKVHNIYQSIPHPNFYIINKENGGKGDSLNSGINFSKDEIIVTLDADCVLKKMH